MNKQQPNSNKVVAIANDENIRLKDVHLPENFINRELSSLKFNHRVLQQSLDENIPLLERIKYLSICSSNIDEFFEVRVAGLRHRVNRNDGGTGADGINPAELLKAVYRDARHLVHEQYRILNEVLLPALEQEKIYFLSRTEWSEADYSWLKNYFRKQVAPVITPISLDLTHPFPRLINKSLHFILRLVGNDAFGRNLDYAVLHMPRSLPRLIDLPDRQGNASEHRIVLLSEVIKEFAAGLFPGMKVKSCHQFRLTRDSDLMIEELEAEDLATALKEELSARDFGASVRLEIGDDCSNGMARFLLQKCGLTEKEMYRVKGPVNLSRIVQLVDLVDRPDLKFPGFTPGVPLSLERGNDMFERIADRDYLLEHPYESFWPIVELLRTAAIDSNVLAIQQTLYRTGSGSPVVDALIDAARAGKEVTAVIELRARFDEAENLSLAQRLQDAGVLVVYGVVGFKTHAKMMLIVRREKNKLKRYAHLGTGNYHVGNAKVYTDYSLLTANKALCEDVQSVFQQLTGMGKLSQLNLIWTAPFTLKQNLLKAIATEIKHRNNGHSARIVAKINALTDVEIVEALYEASQAGVSIDLLIRGICCLRPGVPGLSDNISVHSIVGRFLEHSRIYYFKDNGNDQLFCSSADWMDRNLDRRVEVCFPILQDNIKKRLKDELLNEYLCDSGLSWQLLPDGRYQRKSSSTKTVRVQERLLSALSR